MIRLFRIYLCVKVKDKKSSLLAYEVLMRQESRLGGHVI